LQNHASFIFKELLPRARSFNIFVCTGAVFFGVSVTSSTNQWLVLFQNMLVDDECLTGGSEVDNWFNNNMVTKQLEGWSCLSLRNNSLTPPFFSSSFTSPLHYSPELGGPTACNPPGPPCAGPPMGPGLPLSGPGWLGWGPPTPPTPGDGPACRDDGRDGRSSSLS